jgi:hypothetical protein
MPRFAGFIGGTNLEQSLVSDAEDTVNWYVEQSQSKAAASPSALYPTPGFNPLVTSAHVNGRAACDASGRIFLVLGGELVEVVGGFGLVNRGAVQQDGNPAQIFYGGVVCGQLGIASGSNFYSFVLATNTLTQQLTG